MSEECGLCYIQQLAERDFKPLPSSARSDLFRAQMVPFLEITSHPKVLSSLVAEHPLGLTYSFIYGLSGTRAINLISSICVVLEGLSEKDDVRFQWLEASLAVLSRLLFVNSSAFLQAGIEEQSNRLQRILSSMDREHTAKELYQSRRYLAQIVSRIEAGAKISGPETVQKNQIIKFTPLQNLPGGRHGNDFEDFSLVQIMLTLDEILTTQAEYLPQRNPSRWHVRGLEGLLDWNFRLLREDSIGLLRDTIYQLISEPSGKASWTHVYRGAWVRQISARLNFWICLPGWIPSASATCSHVAA
ncbi:uncharacterized protein BDV17DRAFT_168391 [Aspergillus undulatus]|uniref:uncharacterized protein n=1 Tax=Aspergillus undulatus TaxID=1810928 RepID=UPI003CCDBF1D